MDNKNLDCFFLSCTPFLPYPWYCFRLCDHKTQKQSRQNGDKLSHSNFLCVFFISLSLFDTHTHIHT